MPRVDLPMSTHLLALGTAAAELGGHAAAAGRDAPVPGCPDWIVADLVAHQGMVHRWATATLEGRDVDDAALEAEGLAAPEPTEWLAAGAAALVTALEGADDDLDVRVFLRDPPPPRQFWARRQAHETTVHAVDALAAALGRAPLAVETWIDPLVAADGVDELLTGFLTRSTSRLRSERPLRVVVAPPDAALWWQVDVGEGPPVTTRHAVGPGSAHDGSDADLVLTAPAVPTYLTLWNRGDEATAHAAGRAAEEALELWRATARVT